MPVAVGGTNNEMERFKIHLLLVAIFLMACGILSGMISVIVLAYFSSRFDGVAYVNIVNGVLCLSTGCLEVELVRNPGRNRMRVAHQRIARFSLIIAICTLGYSSQQQWFVLVHSSGAVVALASVAVTLVIVILVEVGLLISASFFCFIKISHASTGRRTSSERRRPQASLMTLLTGGMTPDPCRTNSTRTRSTLQPQHAMLRPTRSMSPRLSGVDGSRRAHSSSPHRRHSGIDYVARLPDVAALPSTTLRQLPQFDGNNTSGSQSLLLPLPHRHASISRTSRSASPYSEMESGGGFVPQDANLPPAYTELTPPPHVDAPPDYSTVMQHPDTFLVTESKP